MLTNVELGIGVLYSIYSWTNTACANFSEKKVPAATFRRLFEDLPRPAPLPPSPYPNCHPYAVREEEPLPAVVEVDSGPLITYWDHDYTVPIPGVGSGPPAWWPYSPVDNESPCPSPSASPPPLPPTSGPSPPFSTTPMPPPGPSSPAPPPALPTAPPHKALKTYLGRTRRGISPPSGRSPLSVLPSPARLPARRKKEEKRCGRWNYLKCMSFFQFSGSRCLACKSPKCMDCHTCLNPQKKQGRFLQNSSRKIVCGWGVLILRMLQFRLSFDCGEIFL